MDNIGILIIKELNIKHCIVVDEDDKLFINHYSNARLFTKANIYSIFMNIKNFTNYLARKNYANSKTAVLIRTNKMANVLTNYLNKVS